MRYFAQAEDPAPSEMTTQTERAGQAADIMRKQSPRRWLELLPYAFLPLLVIILWFGKGEQLDILDLLLRELLLIFGYIASLYDLRTRRVPNRLIGMMLAAWVLLMAPQLIWRPENVWPFLWSGIIGFLLAGVLLLLVYMISRKGLGGGDVKLMSAAGLYLGLDGVLPTLLYGSLLAALCGAALILLRKLGPRDAIPLVPFLYVGMLLTIFIR